MFYTGRIYRLYKRCIFVSYASCIRRIYGAEGTVGVRTDALNFFLASVSVEVALPIIDVLCRSYIGS